VRDIQSVKPLGINAKKKKKNPPRRRENENLLKSNHKPFHLFSENSIIT
jgi:hypothetical protein